MQINHFLLLKKSKNTSSSGLLNHDDDQFEDDFGLLMHSTRKAAMPRNVPPAIPMSVK